MKCVQLVGPPVGQNGQCTFYRSFKFCQPEQLASEILNGKSQGSIKSSRVLQIGQFFFVRTSPADDPCIGELQMLWQDNQTNQSLASVRLYFLPEQTPDGRKTQHGEHEVLAASEKVNLRLEVLGQWITDQVDWTHGLLAPVQREVELPLSKSLAKIENGGHKGSNGLVQVTNNPEINHNGISKSNDVETDVSTRKLMDSIADEFESASVIVLSYTHYCRYRALMLRLGNQCDKWLQSELVKALGGLTVTSKNTRVLFCRETFDHDGLFNDLNNCDHLAPSVKGRSKKKRLKNLVPVVVARSQSPGSESNTSEEVKSPAKITANTEFTSPEVNNGNNNNNNNNNSNSKKAITDEEKDFLEKLYKFMQDKETPINRVPHLGFRQIDLYVFYQYAQKLGGYKKVTFNKMWKHIYDEMGGNPGSTSAATCTRRHYERLLLPFENHLHGIEDTTPLPKKRSKKDGSNDDLLDDDADLEEGESLSGEGDAFDPPIESQDATENGVSETVVTKEEIKVEEPVEILPTVVPSVPVEVVIKPEEVEVKEIPKPIEIIEDKDIEILEIPVVPSILKRELKEEIKVLDKVQEPEVIKIETRCPEVKHSLEEAAMLSDDEGNIPLAFLNKMNHTKPPVPLIAKNEPAPTPKLEVPTVVQGGQQDSEVEILEAKEAEEIKMAESSSMASQTTSGHKKQRVRDNVFSEKERQWNEIRKKNAMARTWVKKGSKSASTSPLHRHFGPSTIPDQPGDCANMVCAKLPPSPSATNHRHQPIYSHHPNKSALSKPTPTNVLPPLPPNAMSKPLPNHRLPPSMNLLESSKPLPIANPPPPSNCGYITCGIRNPNCYGSNCGSGEINNHPIVNKQRSTKVNYHHHPGIMADNKTTYRSSYPHQGKELSNGTGRSSSRSLSPTNQPRPSVIQHTEEIHSPPPPGGSQPLPAHLSSSKSMPGIHQSHLSASRSRSLYPSSSQGSNSSVKSRGPYDVASIRTSSVGSRSANNHLKAPDIYAKTESTPKKEMPGLLPIRALPDYFFQQPAKHSNLVKSLTYAKESSSYSSTSSRRHADTLPSNLPGYQRPVPVPPALAPSTPVYQRGDCGKVPDSDPCEAEVLDLSLKRKSSSSNGRSDWPPLYEDIPLAEGECLDLSVKKRKVEPIPLTTLSDEARGIENVTPPSPSADPAVFPSILSPVKTPIASLNLGPPRSISSEKAPNSVRRIENRSPPMLIPLNETRTPYSLESELIAQQQRQLQRKASEYAAYQQYANGHASVYPATNNWSLSQSLIHQPTPHRSNPTLPSEPRTPSENLAAYSELVERGLLTGQIPYSLAPHLYPLMQHYQQSFSK